MSTRHTLAAHVFFIPLGERVECKYIHIGVMVLFYYTVYIYSTAVYRAMKNISRPTSSAIHPKVHRNYYFCVIYTDHTLKRKCRNSEIQCSMYFLFLSSVPYYSTTSNS